MLGKTYDLADRTSAFAKRVRAFLSQMPKTFIVFDDCKQLLRSSGSVAANYIEANECLGKADCRMKMRICKKEARESGCWLEMIEPSVPENLRNEHTDLVQEARELKLIFNAIVQKLIS